MQRLTEWLSWRALMLLVVFGFGLLQLAPWVRSNNREAAARQSDCAAWDRAASEGISTLISDTSAAAELRLDEAILQLRRARKSCRSGAIALARHDYVSLHQAFPGSTGSIQSGAAHAPGAMPVVSVRDAPDAGRRSDPFPGSERAQ